MCCCCGSNEQCAAIAAVAAVAGQNVYVGYCALQLNPQLRLLLNTYTLPSHLMASNMVTFFAMQ